MKILIIEDESPASRRLQKMVLELHPDSQILDILDSIEGSLQWLESHPAPDLILADIHLADGMSFSIFEEAAVSCPIIFTTAYDQYAIDAFKLNSIDYLLKPIKKAELERALDKFEKLHGSLNRLDYSRLAAIMRQDTPQFQKRIVIRYGPHIKAIEIAEAAYFYIESKVCMLRTREGKDYPVDYSLEQLEEILDPALFFRINRKVIAHIEAISQMYAYSKSRVKIDFAPPFDQEVVVSSERASLFKEWLKGA